MSSPRIQSGSLSEEAHARLLASGSDDELVGWMYGPAAVRWPAAKKADAAAAMRTHHAEREARSAESETDRLIGRASCRRALRSVIAALGRLGLEARRLEQVRRHALAPKLTDLCEQRAAVQRHVHARLLQIFISRCLKVGTADGL